MQKTISKEQFHQLDFDNKCAIIEQLLTDDYFSGQRDIGFYLPKDFDPEVEDKLPEKLAHIKKVEDQKFNDLVQRLSAKLFETSDQITYELN